jgi:hypothetical protein
MSLSVVSRTRTASSQFRLLAIIGIFIAHAWYLWCPAEDAFISLRFAQNLAAGHGFTWNVGAPPVEGYTNFLWVVLCAGAIKLGLNALFFAQVIGLASGIGLILLTYRAGRELLGWPEPVALVPALLLACAGPLATWATSGMEMTLFAFLGAAPRAARCVWCGTLIVPDDAVAARRSHDCRRAVRLERPAGAVRSEEPASWTSGSERDLRGAFRGVFRVAVPVLRIPAAEHVLRKDGRRL